MNLEVRIDRAACRGAGSCVRRAPRSFALDRERKSTFTTPPGDGDEYERIVDAARSCPHFAIAVARAGRRVV
jgi:ferredoxin